MSNSYYEGGRVIPGAGTYLHEQNKAKSAYDRAVAQLQAQRAKRQISSGLGKDWNVDPNAQYGTYQQMLQGQGLQLQAGEEQAQQRGFFGAGLGNQAESALRYGHAVEGLGFKNQLTDWENEFQFGMTDASRSLADANYGSLSDSYNDSFNDGDFTPYDPNAPVQPPWQQSSVAGPARAALGITPRTAPASYAPKGVKTMSTKASVAAAAKYGWGGIPQPKPKPKPTPVPPRRGGR